MFFGLIEKMQDKKKLCFFSKKVISFLDSKSLVFTFALKIELGSSYFSVLATKTCFSNVLDMNEKVS